MKNSRIIILAAGSSARLGVPKQLLRLKGKSLIAGIAEAAAASQGGPVVAVIGAYRDQVLAEAKDLPVAVTINERWREGIGSSIGQGIKHLKTIEPEAGSVIILLCDQPFVNQAYIDRLISEYHSHKCLIAASGYGNSAGVPALFDSRLFEELENLQGDQGAKGIIKKYAGETRVVPFPEGTSDIDTWEDYQKTISTDH